MWDIIEASFLRAPWGWALLGSVITGFFVLLPKIKKLSVDEHSQMRQEYVDEIRALRQDIKELRTENAGLSRELADVRVELAGYKKQHLAEQAAAIRNIPAIREAVQDVVKGDTRGNA